MGLDISIKKTNFINKDGRLMAVHTVLVYNDYKARIIKITTGAWDYKYDRIMRTAGQRFNIAKSSNTPHPAEVYAAQQRNKG